MRLRYTNYTLLEVPDQAALNTELERYDLRSKPEPLERLILYKRLILGQTYEHIGKSIIGPVSKKPLSKERVRQILVFAFRRHFKGAFGYP